MSIDLEKIVNIKKIRIEKSELLAREKVLSAPLLSDFSLIPSIYDKFLSIQKGDETSDAPEDRRIFIFIILYLFSPSTLAGDRIKTGLRELLSRTVGYSDEHITRIVIDLIFIYSNFKGFRLKCDRVYESIRDYLSERGYITQN